MNKQKGFSLIELLLVVAVIGIVAAIAVPNLLASRRAANEGSTIASLRTLYGANMSYASTSGNGNYAGLAGTVGQSSLADLLSANLIDPAIAEGTKSSYVFAGDREAATPTTVATFYFSANPITTLGPVRTGNRRFGVATDGVVKSDATQANLATPFDAASLQTAIAVPVGN